jgi:hypothetical protein
MDSRIGATGSTPVQQPRGAQATQETRPTAPPFRSPGAGALPQLAATPAPQTASASKSIIDRLKIDLIQITGQISDANKTLKTVKEGRGAFEALQNYFGFNKSVSLRTAEETLSTAHETLAESLKKAKADLSAENVNPEEITKQLGELVYARGLASLVATLSCAKGEAEGLAAATIGTMDKVLQQAEEQLPKQLKTVTGKINGFKLERIFENVPKFKAAKFQEKIPACITQARAAITKYERATTPETKKSALAEFKKAEVELTRLETQLNVYEKLLDYQTKLNYLTEFSERLEELSLPDGSSINLASYINDSSLDQALELLKDRSYRCDERSEQYIALADKKLNKMTEALKQFEDGAKKTENLQIDYTRREKVYKGLENSLKDKENDTAAIEAREPLGLAKVYLGLTNTIIVSEPPQTAADRALAEHYLSKAGENLKEALKLRQDIVQEST